MGQAYHNYIDLVGTQEQRQGFLADALRLSGYWGWDLVSIDFNDQAPRAEDSGKSVLNFYTLNFPKGLDLLMKLHPTVTIIGTHKDISLSRQYLMMMRDNVIIEESEEELIPYDDFTSESEVQVHHPDVGEIWEPKTKQ